VKHLSWLDITNYSNRRKNILQREKNILIEEKISKGVTGLRKWQKNMRCGCHALG
jgi:hypothetical protein